MAVHIKAVNWPIIEFDGMEGFFIGRLTAVMGSGLFGNDPSGTQPWTCTLGCINLNFKCVRNMENYVVVLVDDSILDIELFTTTGNMFLSLIVHIVS